MVRRSVPVSSTSVANECRLCLERHSRHTYATEMLRAGVTFPALMKLLGHTSPGMTMQYLDVALTDLQQEVEMARSKPRHLVPQPRAYGAETRTYWKHEGSRK